MSNNVKNRNSIVDKMKKLGYYLSVAYYDIFFRIFFGILILKLILFTDIIGLGGVGSFGIISFYSSFGIILITLSFSLLIGNIFFKFIYLYFLNLLYSLLFFIHSLNLKYFNDFASLYSLAQIPQLPSIADMLIGMIGKELLFVLDFIFFSPLLIFMRKERYKYSIYDRIKSLVIILLLGLYLNAPLLSIHTKLANNFLVEIYYRRQFVNIYGVINYQIADAYYYLLTRIKKEQLTQADIDSVIWRKRRSNLKENDLTIIGKGMNLIIIQVESLQNFVIGKKYHNIEITPNLNRLAKEGIYFRNIYDQTAAGNSSDATLLANASLYPARKGAASFLYPNNCFDSLPKALREHGYTTAAMHANYKSYWNSEMFEKALGFEHQFYKENYTMIEKVGWGLSDKAFFSQSLEKIKGLPTPFYSFLRTLTTHGPFDDVTADIDDFPLDDLQGKRIGNYLRSMHYVDSAIGEFLQKLSGYNLGSNTVIVIYGDHRARMFETELRRIDISDMSEIRKVPLIINLPNRKEKDERDKIGGLIDVAPTICNILGIDMSGKFFIGNDLGNGESSFVIFRDGSYISEDRSLTETSAKQWLMISDLVLEKDMIPVIRNGQGCKE